jgi:hypothetical protein
MFLMVLRHSIKTGKISSTSAIINMILVWTPNGNSLECHMANVRVMGLGEQLKASKKGKSAKTLMKSSS